MYINKIYYHQFHPQVLPEPDVSLLAHPAPIDQPAVGFALLSGSSHEMVDRIVKLVDATPSLNLDNTDEKNFTARVAFIVDPQQMRKVRTNLTQPMRSL